MIRRANSRMTPDALTPQQRAMLLAWELANGAPLDVPQIMALTGLSRSKVYRLLALLIAVRPVCQLRRGVWQRMAQRAPSDRLGE